MINFYTAKTPNGQKVELMLEELEADYTKHNIDLKAMEQKKPEFLAMNPNGRIPVILDEVGPENKPLAVFESAAILFYLAERFGKFGGRTLTEKTKVMEWMMFQMSAVGPMFGNYYYGKNSLKPLNAGFIERFENESKRILNVLETHLSSNTYFAGEYYSIADMCMFFWLYRFSEMEPLWLSDKFAIKRWLSLVASRPKVHAIIRA